MIRDGFYKKINIYIKNWNRRKLWNYS
jgi:hypothetical protein